MKVTLSGFFLFACLLFSNIQANEPELLKQKDINKIMEQIFAQHVDQKHITSEIVKNSIETYINQFDPNRIYLLKAEVAPYQNMSKIQLDRIMEQYRKNDFTAYEQLNSIFQKAIVRARDYRTELEKDQPGILADSKNVKHNPFIEVSDKKYANEFVSSESDLKKRIRQEIVNFIAAERQLYGDAAVIKNEGRMLSSYERQMRVREDEYSFQQENGTPMAANEKENLFSLHVLKSLASSLDAHTAFLNPLEAYDLRLRLEKGFQGIGVMLQNSPQGTFVKKLVPGGPAEKSGQINENDILVKINSTSIKDVPLEKVTDLLRDASKTSMTLVFERDRKPFTVVLKPEEITLNNERVDVTYDNFGNGIIGKITLHSFYQNDNGVDSEKDVRDAIATLRTKGNLKGLVLDLRDNSGGFLNQAVKVAGLFITNGVVVISKYSNGEEKFYRDMDGKVAYDGPLIVLTSKATASAAEIVAQALQDYGVAVVVGDAHTYGKGTIQTQTVTDNNAASFFKVTVGKYYTVSGKTPQIQGVKADVVVPGPYSQLNIGESYLSGTVKSDTISEEYKDDLSDINPSYRPWYMRYYVPTIQQRNLDWKDMLPELKKNSEYRMAHNKNYQLFLKKLKGEEVLPDLADEEIGTWDKKNFGEEDLQMSEAVNIAKDMSLFQSQRRHQPKDSKLMVGSEVQK